MTDWFNFAGRSSEELCLRVESYPKIPVPQRYVETFNVPGRSGDLHYEHKAFKNVSRAYECYYHDGSMLASQAARDIKSWLTSHNGYQRLTDAYEPGFYRMARFDKSSDIEVSLKRYGRLTITFNCKPQLYSVDGDNAIELLSPTTLYNPYAFDADPLITIYGSGEGYLIVGKSQIKVLENPDYLVIDSERMDVYREKSENRNYAVALLNDEFPVLTPGANLISWTGKISKIKIAPRWWTL